jgi:hypothetical protein
MKSTKANAAQGRGASEPSPRLIMAVVAIGVIVGALISPGASTKQSASASTSVEDVNR